MALLLAALAAWTTVRETRRWHKDGTALDVSISAAPLYDAQGNVTGIMAVLADITDRKAAEHALALERMRRLQHARQIDMLKSPCE